MKKSIMKKEDFELKETLKNNLKKLRIKFGYTQQEIADYLLINRTTYTKYESDDSLPSIFILRDLAKLYHVNINNFLEWG